MRTQKSLLIILTGLFIISGFSSVIFAAYPERPITMIVSFRAGGGVDTTARLLGKAMSEHLGQPVLITNKPGRGGGIAANTLKRAKADGYTVNINVASAFTFNPHAGKRSSYYVDDFEYVASVALGQEALVTRADSKWNSFSDLIESARKEGGHTFSTFTPVERMYLKVLAAANNVKLIPVPTKGGAGMIPQLLGGHVDFAYSGGAHYKHVKSGKMKVLAATGFVRLVDFPNVPTLQEQGFAMAFENLVLIAAPKGTPSNILKTIRGSVRAALKDPKVIDILVNKIHWPVADKEFDELQSYMLRADKNNKKVVASLKK
ncbi:MAG: tripartite tricarboxylate transporter substrate binding protein [Proteobacteria bacterium]|nr:tripartite tricarboxylate transporter substrate binding protein [Pseudomonadota bacterium]